MEVPHCKICCSNEHTEMQPNDPITAFWRREVDEWLVRECTKCGNKYVMSISQCLLYFVLTAFSTAILKGMSGSPFLFLITMFVYALLLPLKLDIPQRYLPWKHVGKEWPYPHLKMTVAFWVAECTGVISGFAIAFLAFLLTQK